MLHSNAELTEFEDNTLTSNDMPMRLSPGHLDQIDESTSYAGNETDHVEVRSGSIGSESIISALDVPYESEDINVDDDVTIEAGAELYFHAETRIRVNDGPLVIAGEEGNPVLLSGTEQTPGWWRGVWYRDAEHPSNSVDYAIIEYSGQAGNHDSNEPAGLTLARSRRDASASVTNSIFRNNAGNGMHVHSNGTITDFQDNTFEGNEEYGLSIRASQIDVIEPTSTYEDNGHDAIEVRGGTVGTDTQWRDTGVPWHVRSNMTVDSDDTLTLEAGMEALFDADTRLRSDMGRLYAEGTDDDPVILEGLEPNSGWWAGVYIRRTEDGIMNEFDHVEIRHAGSSAHHSSVEPAAVTVARSRRDASFSITNSLIEEVSNATDTAYGIYVHGNGTVNSDICEANEFGDIDGVDCEM